MIERESIIYQSEKHVDTYILSQATEVFMKADAMNDGKGCQCASCFKEAASALNSWLNIFDIDNNLPRYYYNGDKLVIAED